MFFQQANFSKMLKSCYRTVVSSVLRSFTWGFYPNSGRFMVPLPSCCILPRLFPYRRFWRFRFSRSLVVCIPAVLPAAYSLRFVAVFHAAFSGKSQSTTIVNNYITKLSFLYRYHVILTVLEKTGKIVLQGSYLSLHIYPMFCEKNCTNTGNCGLFFVISNACLL
jgi:hypothetical protein